MAPPRLGVTQGAMRTMLATVGQAQVPDEELVMKLAEVFEQTRKAASVIRAQHRRWRRQFKPSSMAVPIVTVTLPAAVAYDALLSAPQERLRS
jgi:hypothetical protein